MVALQYTTSIIVLCDGSTEAAPWTPFHVTYGKVTTVQDTAEWVPDPRPPWNAPHGRSPHDENRTGPHGSGGYYKYTQKKTRAEHVTCCGVQALKICVVHVHNLVKWDETCTELRSMYKTRLDLLADIVCRDVVVSIQGAEGTENGLE